MTALRPLELGGLDPATTPVRVNVEVERSTGSLLLEIPIPTTAGRDGHGPSLALRHVGYDPLSAFPHGWTLTGLPSIDIDMRDGLPRYDGTDRFTLAGQELIPLDSSDRPTA